MADYVWGRYPVLEALRSKRRVHRIMIAQGPRDIGLTQVLDQARRVEWLSSQPRGDGWMRSRRAPITRG